jgi:hypothetical protein
VFAGLHHRGTGREEQQQRKPLSESENNQDNYQDDKRSALVHLRHYATSIEVELPLT